MRWLVKGLVGNSCERRFQEWGYLPSYNVKGFKCIMQAETKKNYLYRRRRLGSRVSRRGSLPRELNMQLILRGRDVGTLVFLVHNHIIESPLNPRLKSVLADRTIFFGADAARKVEAGVGMHKKLHGFSKSAADECRQGIDLGMGFQHVEVPGYGEMAVDVEQAPVFDDTEV